MDLIRQAFYMALKEPSFKEILKSKRDYYGNTEAAIEFAAEQYASEWHEFRLLIVKREPISHTDFE
jgi:hypothetical protein